MRVIHNLDPNLLLTKWFKQDQHHNTAEWPRCYICKTNVRAYGIEHEGSGYIEVFARCHGKDKDYLRINWNKQAISPTWEQLMMQIRRLVFYGPGSLGYVNAFGQVSADLSRPDAVISSEQAVENAIAAMGEQVDGLLEKTEETPAVPELPPTEPEITGLVE